MKRSSSQPRKRTTKVITVCIASIMAFTPTISLAGSATVTYPGLGVTRSYLPPPVIDDNPRPAIKTIQSNTELDTNHFTGPDSQPGVAQPVEPSTQPADAKPGETTAKDTPKLAAPKSIPKIGIGIDTLFSDDVKIYTVPISYTLNRNFTVQLTLPVVTANFDASNDGVKNPKTNTGMGDVGLSLKHRIGSENDVCALYSILSAKFATGDANKGFGTGTYDIALTEKVIKRFGGFRGTIMGGITQPLNDPTILGAKVEYGTTISFMAALEHTIGLPDLWFGVRAEGMHSFEKKVDGLARGDALTTLDVSPEFKFYYKRYTSLNIGASFPVLTEYTPQAGDDPITRKWSVNFGVSTMF